MPGHVGSKSPPPRKRAAVGGAGGVARRGVRARGPAPERPG